MILQNQATAGLRVLGLFLVNSITGLPSGTSIDKTNVQLHKHGGTWVNSTNDPSPDPSRVGAWELQLTQAEVDTLGPLGYRVVATDVRLFLEFEQIVDAVHQGSFLVSQPIAALRVLPILVIDSGTGDPSSITIDHTNVQLHKHGGSWVASLTDPTADAGQTGVWYLQMNASELNTIGPLGWSVSKTGLRDETSFELVVDTASGGGPTTGAGVIVSLSPANGMLTKWTPVVAVVEPRAFDDIWLVYQYGGIPFSIYDPDNGFSPFWAVNSTIVSAPPNPGTGALRFTVTLLPNGGWQTVEFDILYASGKEMT